MDTEPADVGFQTTSTSIDFLMDDEPQTVNQPDILEMTDEDSLIVSQVVERVISRVACRDDLKTSLEAPSNKSSSPPSLDYEDFDDLDHTKENRIATKGVTTDRRRVDSSLSSLDSDCLVDSNVEETPEYVVEELVAKRDHGGNIQYYIKWKGFPSNSNTWEPVENLSECNKMMERFEVRSAKRLAERNRLDDENQTPQSKRRPNSHSKEYEVNDVMGLTTVQGEMYFLVSLANSTQKTFIRASLANKIIPQKVIDFYIKSMKWKTVSSA